jgi:uncharacterized protein YbaR (Trm112 family)
MESKRRDALHCPNCDSVDGPYLRFARPNLVMTCALCGDTYDIQDLIALVEDEAGANG